MHDLLRAYAREHAASDCRDGDGAEDHDEVRRAALTRLFDYYLQIIATAMDTLFAARRHQWSHSPATGISPDVSSTVAAWAWLEAELGNLVAATAQMTENDWPGHAARLASAIFPYLERAGRATEAIIMHGHALRASRRTGDSAAEATALGNLGYVLLLQGHYPQAASHLRQAMTLFRQAGDQAGEATAVGNLAVIDRRLGRYQQAADHQSHALALARQTGDQWGEALALTRLGGIERHLGRCQQAFGHIQQALSVSRQIGDPISEAEALTRLGVVERHLGRLHQAADHHELAIALFRHGDDPAGEAEALNGLGELSLAMGRSEHGLLHHAAARDLAEQTGSLDEQARAHHGLACAHQAAGTRDQAQSHFEEAIRLYSRLGAPEASQIRGRLGTTDGNGARHLARRESDRQTWEASPSS